MWDVIWYLGFPMFAVSVFGAPYEKQHEFDEGYNSDQYDVLYDQRQNGTENYRVNVDGLSLVWSPNSLLAAAALLEPALYGEYPETNIDVILGPDNSKPEEQPVSKPEVKPSQEINSTEPKPAKPSDFSEIAPTLLVINSQKPENSTSHTGTKRKLRLPGILKPFLTKRSSSGTDRVISP